jgi:hypothetical protein
LSQVQRDSPWILWGELVIIVLISTRVIENAEIRKHQKPPSPVVLTQSSLPKQNTWLQGQTKLCLEWTGRLTNTSPTSIIQQPHAPLGRCALLLNTSVVVIVFVVLVVRPVDANEIDPGPDLLNQLVQRLLVPGVVF